MQSQGSSGLDGACELLSQLQPSLPLKSGKFLPEKEPWTVIFPHGIAYQSGRVPVFGFILRKVCSSCFTTTNHHLSFSSEVWGGDIKQKKDEIKIVVADHQSCAGGTTIKCFSTPEKDPRPPGTLWQSWRLSAMCQAHLSQCKVSKAIRQPCKQNIKRWVLNELNQELQRRRQWFCQFSIWSF